MRAIKIPEVISISATENRPTGPAQVEVPFSFFTFIEAMLMSDRRFNSNAQGGFAAERIKARMRLYEASQSTDEPEPHLSLETTDAETLKAVVNEPTDGYPIKPLFVIAPYLRAVAEQTEVDQ